MSSVFNLRLSDLDSKKKSMTSVKDVSLSHFIKNNKQATTRKLHVSDLKASALKKLHVSDLKASALKSTDLKKSSSRSGKLRLSDLRSSSSSGKLHLSDLGKKKKTTSSSGRKLSLKDLFGGKRRKSRKGGAHDYDESLSASDIQAIKQSNGMYDLQNMDL
jgi:hypothetical protein